MNNFEALMEMIDDIELMALAKQRQNEEDIEVTFDDL